MSNFDVIVVGAGPAGIFTCYELSLKAPHLKILLLEKGKNIYERSCPILEKKITQCPKNSKDGIEISGCVPSCSITSGFGGAGAYSDGKFNITTEFGGWLTEYIPNSIVLDLIKYVDELNLLHGANNSITNPKTKEVSLIEKMAYGSGLKLLRSEVRQLGTEENLQILKAIFEYLKDKIQMKFKSTVSDILIGKEKQLEGVILENGEEIFAKKVVLVPGRDGSAWLNETLKKHNISMINNQVDIGVRVEVSDVIMQDINKHLYEGKFIFNTSVGTRVRTFCSNPSGHVVIENHSGIMAANGHAYKDPKLGSENTNFALLVSHTFTEPFSRPNEYAREICKRANELSDGSLIIQKFGDILKGRRSTEKRIKEGFLDPTLKEAVPGDLGLVLPYNTMKSLIEMVHALDGVTPGIASEHTLFYGIEAKFYSARPTLEKTFESKNIKGLYFGGDGAGLTRGLAQAGACGVYIARNLILTSI